MNHENPKFATIGPNTKDLTAPKRKKEPKNEPAKRPRLKMPNVKRSEP